MQNLGDIQTSMMLGKQTIRNPFIEEIDKKQTEVINDMKAASALHKECEKTANLHAKTKCKPIQDIDLRKECEKKEHAQAKQDCQKIQDAKMAEYSSRLIGKKLDRKMAVNLRSVAPTNEPLSSKFTIPLFTFNTRTPNEKPLG